MAHPFKGQADSSEKARLKRLGGTAGKSFGSSSMYSKKSYPSERAGTQREFTIPGGKGRSRPDRLASGGAVGKRHHRPHNTTNIIISHAGGRGGSGGGGGSGPPGPPGPIAPRPVPVPVGGPGAASPMPPPGGAAPVRPMPPPMAGGPMVPPRPPMPMGPPPGARPPGMASGGVVKKANGGFLKESKGTAYAGYPNSPTSEAGDKVSAHKKGGPVKKRQLGGGLGGGGIGAGGTQAGGGLPGLLGSAMPGRAPQGPQQGPPNISGRPMIPAQPLTVPQPKLATSIFQRPAPGTSTTYKKGGAVEHDDEAEDRALIKKMVKPKDLKRARGGVVNPGHNERARGLAGSSYHQQGKGYQDGGVIKTPLTNKTGSGAGGEGRLAKTRAAKSVPEKTEA